MFDKPSPSALLNRPERTRCSPSARALIDGSRVLVTGAGGSIGSELCRQIAALNPARLFMLDHDETLLQTTGFDILGDGLLESEDLILADIREPVAIGRAMAHAQPDIVFHAAAHKHLTLLENHPSEGVRTNVLGTRNVLRAAFAAGVSRFVNVSTDKAADPVSVLGATKRAGEMLVSAYGASRMASASVRFGNVLGSRGSFLPLLEHQLELGMPITITDPRAERFFMTIPEAAGLVIEAAALAAIGQTFVLDMGDPIRLLDLVNRYAALAGIDAPPIVVSGLRPGEKLSEVLFAADEVAVQTKCSRIWTIPPAHLASTFLLEFSCLEAASEQSDDQQTMSLLQTLVCGCAPARHVDVRSAAQQLRTA